MTDHRFPPDYKPHQDKDLPDDTATVRIRGLSRLPLANLDNYKEWCKKVTKEWDDS